jgi:hypothetical protein
MDITRGITAAAVLVGAAIGVACPAWADNYLTQSGKMLCGVSPDPTFPPDSVICKGPFTQRPGWSTPTAHFPGSRAT